MKTGASGSIVAKASNWQVTITVQPIHLLARTAVLGAILLLAAAPANRSGSAAVALSPAQQAWSNAIVMVETVLVSRANHLGPERRAQLARVVVSESLSCGLDPLFALAVGSAESALDHEAVSPTGARGLYQVLPSTWNREVARRGLGYLEKFDPLANARVGIGYLCHLRKTFRRPENLLLAYNQGPGRAGAIIAGRVQPTSEASAYGTRVWHAYRALLRRAGVVGGHGGGVELRAFFQQPERTVYTSALGSVT